jgi:hypothetical protein
MALVADHLALRTCVPDRRQISPVLQFLQSHAHGVAARLEALAQVHFTWQAAADDMDADANFLAQGFGDFQIARPARRAHAGAVALFLGMTLVGSARMFGHNGNSGAARIRNDGHDNKAAGGAGTARRDAVPDPALAGERPGQRR